MAGASAGGGGSMREMGSPAVTSATTSGGRAVSAGASGKNVAFSTKSPTAP